MGKPLTIQEYDDKRLNSLKKPLGVKTKVQVLRMALDNLEEKIEREKMTRRRAMAAKLVAAESERVNRGFQTFSRIKNL